MLIDVALSVLADVNPKRAAVHATGDELVTFIPMSDVSESGRWVHRQTRPYCEVRSGYTCFNGGDVLFAKITPCTENGKGCHATGLVGGIGFASTEFHVLRAKDDADAGFIFQWSIDLLLRRKAAASMTGSAGQQRVPASFFSSFTVPRLPKPEQSKIAEVLSTVDRAMAQTEALIAKQQRIKTGLMQDLLTCGIDEHGQLRSEATHAFKDSPLGRIPVEWEVKHIDDLVSRVGSGVTPTGGESVYTADGVLFIRSQNVHFDGLRLDDVAYIPSHIHHSMMRSEVFENDVLLNITGASIGRCCPMPNVGARANVNQHVCTIRLRDVDQARTGFLTAILKSHIGQHQIALMNAGGNREGLNYQQVRNFQVPWPTDSSEFARVYSRIELMDAAVADHSVSLTKLHHLKTALMQDLLTGKVRVTPLLQPAEDATA
ncbi:restriction endonuclease subunit S [Lysobacter sp. A378]